ncbi:hypothetical protein K493DRAFT_300390 [Basidiobolus meristosporus CBS 931.73]|uniref:G-protein coupled receptors family 1 profile domain-containing protein n=1 Tax=Basidiobolus meristosporus CBS 931.73 TaxID=1314790 RepID=A0A1Y1YHL7_9FUNG|nr:hypothetical protein K493DRAFT_300390 [Basidiobolus meristosporus CBS 931.73]|eukprot:ORX97527.1 hypothetical protein K493DRAFT_300390 [Basidiobolus meristosporus CBS 931.73]
MSALDVVEAVVRWASFMSAALVLLIIFLLSRYRSSLVDRVSVYIVVAFAILDMVSMIFEEVSDHQMATLLVPGCSVIRGIVQAANLLIATLTFCMALNMYAVIVRGKRGFGRTKWYFITSIFFSLCVVIVQTISITASGSTCDAPVLPENRTRSLIHLYLGEYVWILLAIVLSSLLISVVRIRLPKKSEEEQQPWAIASSSIRHRARSPPMAQSKVGQTSPHFNRSISGGKSPRHTARSPSFIISTQAAINDEIRRTARRVVAYILVVAIIQLPSMIVITYLLTDPAASITLLGVVKVFSTLGGILHGLVFCFDPAFGFMLPFRDRLCMRETAWLYLENSVRFQDVDEHVHQLQII